VDHDTRAGDRRDDLLLEVIHEVVCLAEREVPSGHHGEVHVALGAGPARPQVAVVEHEPVAVDHLLDRPLLGPGAPS
jgi:hypothetical protein